MRRRLSPLFFVFSHRLTSGSHPRETLAGGDDSVRVRGSRVRVRVRRVRGLGLAGLGLGGLGLGLVRVQGLGEG